MVRRVISEASLMAIEGKLIGSMALSIELSFYRQAFAQEERAQHQEFG